MLYLDIENTSYKAVNYAALIETSLHSLPYSLRVMAENAARHSDNGIAANDVAARKGATVPFRPARLLLQDMLGLALLVDIMAMRSKLEEHGRDPSLIDMSLPVDLVIDHSMTVNHWAEKFALTKNINREFEVNLERFAFIKACEARFPNLRVVPPGGGIMHQINLEFFGKTVTSSNEDSSLLIPDTNLGTDSHTTMINGLGVLGWGIGGLEAEAIMLGEASSVNVPKVVGLEMIGVPSNDITTTDIAFVVTEKLRAHGVVDKFVEMFGAGYSKLGVADRATIANMSPEYGSTCVFCPIDANVLRYLAETGRDSEHIKLVEAYAKQQNMFVDTSANKVEYDEIVTIDLSSIGRSVSGPARPEQRVDLNLVSNKLALAEEKKTARRVAVNGVDADVGDGDVIIASVTSCTNTANPRNMVIAGLLAKNAVANGLNVKPFVKTSLLPGSRVTAQYLKQSGLQKYLDELGFNVAAFSCGTCGGMSGALQPDYEQTIKDHDIKGVAVLSGNRNFSGRIHPLASRNILASPPLVIAYALMGTILKDITTEPLGLRQDGSPVMLSDIWPKADEVDAIINEYVLADDFIANYKAIGQVNQHWNELTVEEERYQWLPSNYVTFPPFVKDISIEKPKIRSFKALRPLVMLGDSVTTDHISPSGMITSDSEAGKFLVEQNIEPRDFNTFGTRRGCSEVVIRSTFANYRLKNEMTPDKEGSWTKTYPDGIEMSIFEAINRYKQRGQMLVIIAGKEYGCGSSRDTAAKAPWLAGVKAVVAESFERIHRSNLINMGIAPLCFPAGVTRHSLKLNGSETYDVELSDDLKTAEMLIHYQDGLSKTIALDLRLYNDAERETFDHGGLLPRSFRTIMKEVNNG